MPESSQEDRYRDFGPRNVPFRIQGQDDLPCLLTACHFRPSGEYQRSTDIPKLPNLQDSYSIAVVIDPRLDWSAPSYNSLTSNTYAFSQQTTVHIEIRSCLHVVIQLSVR